MPPSQRDQGRGGDLHRMGFEYYPNGFIEPFTLS